MGSDVSGIVNVLGLRCGAYELHVRLSNFIQDRCPAVAVDVGEIEKGEIS